MSDKDPKVIIDDDVLDDADIIEDAGDYEDDVSFGDDIIEGEEEWDLDSLDDMDSLEEGGAMADPSEPSKKMMLYGVVAAVILGGGALAWSMMSGSNNGDDLDMISAVENPVTLVQDNDTSVESQDIATSLNTEQDAASDAGMLQDLGSINDLLSTTDDATPTIADADANTDDVDSIFAALDTDPQGVQIEAKNDDVPMPAPISNMIEDMDMPMSDNEATDMTDSAAPNLMPMPEVADHTESPEPAMDMDATIASVAEDLNQPMQDLAPVEPFTDASATPQQTAPAIQDMVSDTNPDRLNELEAQITALNSNLASLASKVDALSQTQTQTVSNDTPVVNQTISSLKNTVERLEGQIKTMRNTINAQTTQNSQVRANAPQKTTRATVKKINKTPATTVSSRWVLRGAMPDEAVISNKRSGSVLTVKPGERISGIGTVKSISNKDGQWVVQGTTGRIIQ